MLARMDPAFRAFAISGLKSGAITDDQIVEAAEYATEQGDTDTAHQLMCLIVRANETPASEWTAQQRRGRMRVVSDGGNGE